MAPEFSLDCPTCARPSAFEQPPCADGHGADCPERVCLECGTALIVGGTPERVLPEPAERRAA